MDLKEVEKEKAQDGIVRIGVDENGVETGCNRDLMS
jgi:hypothetical protein